MTNRRWPTSREGFTDCNVLEPTTSWCPRCHSYGFCWGKFVKRVGAEEANKRKIEAQQYRDKITADCKQAALSKTNCVESSSRNEASK